MTRLVLHIGSTKTGSSALQATLFAHREALRAGGVLYSGTGVVSSAHHLVAAALHPNAWNMHKADLPGEEAARHAWAREALAAIGAEAAREGCPLVLLSSEYLWGRFRQPVHAAFAETFADAGIEVAAFLRRPEEWVLSTYLQAIKSGESRAFADWCDAFLAQPRNGLQYFEILDEWHAGSGGARLTVGIYDEEARADVYAAFRRLVPMPEVDREIASSRANPSPDAEGIRKILELNRSDTPEAEKPALRNRILNEHKNWHGTASDTIGRETAGRIREAVRPGLEALRDRHAVPIPEAWLTG